MWSFPSICRPVRSSACLSVWRGFVDNTIVKHCQEVFQSVQGSSTDTNIDSDTVTDADTDTNVDLKNEDDLKNENEDALKYKEDLKNEDNLKVKTTSNLKTTSKNKLELSSAKLSSLS